MTLAFTKVAVIGAGAMGRGIAQIAAQAGSQVWLYDTQPEAIQKARDAVFQQWDKLQDKGRLTAEAVADYKSRLLGADSLHDLAECELVVEAIVEKLDIKKSLFTELEKVLAPTAVLVTNTSSLSVTAIAAALQRPAQFAGYHFFNPVPLMKVVEVIAGLKTDPAVCERLSDFARQMGQGLVHALARQTHQVSQLLLGDAQHTAHVGREQRVKQRSQVARHAQVGIVDAVDFSRRDELPQTLVELQGDEAVKADRLGLQGVEGLHRQTRDAAGAQGLNVVAVVLALEHRALAEPAARGQTGEGDGKAL
jgi:hypothetical protein